LGGLDRPAGSENTFALLPWWRIQQLKDQSQLAAWLRDGSADFVESLCLWR